MTTINISRKQAKTVLAATFPEYAGRKITVRFTDRVTFSDLNWGGGTKNEYKFIRSDGATAEMPFHWYNPPEGLTVDIPTNVMVVEHSYYCGQDLGVTIHVNPAWAPRWLTSGK